jgi:hypothetical protein
VSPAAQRFDRWLRGRFTELNTELEEAYFAAGSVLVEGDPYLEPRKRALLDEGSAAISGVLAEPLPATDEARYQLLGAVGYYMGACRRHELPEALAAPSGLVAASRLALALGSSLGVAPRFVSAHQSSFNPAVDGRYRTFTTLADEYTFLTLNGLGTLAYRRAAYALSSVVPMGISNPLATYPLRDAVAALEDVLRFNTRLDHELDVERFYLNVRPYYKTYRVGAVEYRGANAGDFAAINELDLLLGLARADDPFYQEILADKQGYLPPGDQADLRRTLHRRPLLDELLDQLDTVGPSSALVDNARLFVRICEQHGAAYAFHHHRLVDRFLSRPAAEDAYAAPEGLTASGPPLPDVVAQLLRLADLRAGRDRPAYRTAAGNLNRIRDWLSRVSIGATTASTP